MIDVNGQANLAGAGLNMAQHVMDCGDATGFIRLNTLRMKVRAALKSSTKR